MTGGLAAGLAGAGMCGVSAGVTYPGAIESSVMVVGGGSLVDGVSGGPVEGVGL